MCTSVPGLPIIECAGINNCEEEETEGTREARAGRGGGEEEKEETRGQEADEEKM